MFRKGLSCRIFDYRKLFKLKHNQTLENWSRQIIFLHQHIGNVQSLQGVSKLKLPKMSSAKEHQKSRVVFKTRGYILTSHLFFCGFLVFPPQYNTGTFQLFMKWLDLQFSRFVLLPSLILLLTLPSKMIPHSLLIVSAVVTVNICFRQTISRNIWKINV